MVKWRRGQRADVLGKSFGARGLGDLRLVMLEEGPARGQRLLQMRTAMGLEADIAIDRGFDIAGLRFRGINVGWLGPAHNAAPSSADDQGLGLLRAFDGFLVTCGLDHHGLPGVGPADHFNYPNRTDVVYPLHGRVNSIPALLEHRCIDLDSEEPSIRCVGLVRQSALFAEVLELRRTIELPLLGSTLIIDDQVTNRGSTPARHGMLYHMNLGYPLLDEATLVTGMESRTIDSWKAHPPSPSPDAVETFELVRPENSGKPEIVVSNPACDGLALRLRYDSAALPALGLWQTIQSGIFVLGIEPQTVLGPTSESYREGHSDFLMPGETRRYRIEVELSSGAERATT